MPIRILRKVLIVAGRLLARSGAEEYGFPAATLEVTMDMTMEVLKNEWRIATDLDMVHIRDRLGTGEAVPARDVNNTGIYELRDFAIGPYTVTWLGGYHVLSYHDPRSGDARSIRIRRVGECDIVELSESNGLWTPICFGGVRLYVPLALS